MELRKFDIFVANLYPDDNAFSEDVLVYQALRNIGYPLVIKNEPGIKILTDGARPVLTDSEENWTRLRLIRPAIASLPLGPVLGDIEYGRPHRLATLLHGETTAYYTHTAVPRKKQSYPVEPSVLEGAFLRSLEQYDFLKQQSRMYFEGPDVGNDIFLATPNSSDLQLARQLEEKGIVPITAAALEELIGVTISAYFSKSGWLKP